MAEIKGHEVFDNRATVKLNQPVVQRARLESGEAKSGRGKWLFLAIAVVVITLVYMLG